MTDATALAIAAILSQAFGGPLWATITLGVAALVTARGGRRPPG